MYKCKSYDSTRGSWREIWSVDYTLTRDSVTLGLCVISWGSITLTTRRQGCVTLATWWSWMRAALKSWNSWNFQWTKVWQSHFQLACCNWLCIRPLANKFRCFCTWSFIPSQLLLFRTVDLHPTELLVNYYRETCTAESLINGTSLQYVTVKTLMLNPC